MINNTLFFLFAINYNSIKYAIFPHDFYTITLYNKNIKKEEFDREVEFNGVVVLVAIGLSADDGIYDVWNEGLTQSFKTFKE